MRGRLVILLILALAVGMGGYAWWHSFRRGRQSLRFWGSEAAVLIRYAPQVKLLRLEPAAGGDASETLGIGGRRLDVAGQGDISEVPGLVHARHALVEDASFEWSAARQDRPANWQFALRFVRGERQATVAFDTNCGRVQLVEEGRTGQLRAGLAAAFDRKLQEWVLSTHQY